MSKKYHAKLEPETYFHIYNRTNNKEDLFRQDEDRSAFITLYLNNVGDYVDTLAYCLLGNHFHFLVKTKSIEEVEKAIKSDKRKHVKTQIRFLESKDRTDLYPRLFKIQFMRLFSSYSHYVNLKYDRKGNLFNKSYKRVPCQDIFHLRYLFYYIHSNPVKHGLTNDPYSWEWSSFSSFYSDDTHIINKEVALKAFGDLETFSSFHEDLAILTDLDGNHPVGQQL